jgi:hypothetical protein
VRWRISDAGQPLAERGTDFSFVSFATTTYSRARCCGVARSFLRCGSLFQDQPGCAGIE